MSFYTGTHSQMALLGQKHVASGYNYTIKIVIPDLKTWHNLNVMLTMHRNISVQYDQQDALFAFSLL
jgi:hypothetical protein